MSGTNEKDYPMKTIRLLAVAFFVTAFSMLSNAQSMYMAKQYYNQGKYLEAAKQLRPLADGGNAEAQTMAAKMFFEGKGVTKSNDQGVKYATLAADQGYEDAILLLADYYTAKDRQKAVNLLKTSLEKFPRLKDGKVNDKYKTMMSKSLYSKETPTLTGNAPSLVAAGEQFRLTYTVNTQDVEGFRAGNIPDAFEVLMGPSTSTQTSIQMLNGEEKQTSSITYIYILQASKNGSFTIPAAHITANGKNIESNTLKVTVSGNYKKAESKESVTTSSDITDSDLFVKASIDKKNVRLGDSLTLTLKLYTLVNVTSLDAGIPDIDACYFEEWPLPREKSFEVEQYNEKNYRTVVWQKYKIVPLKTGTIVIHPQKFDCIVVSKDRNIDPFEAFFNGGTANTEVKKRIYSPQISFTVNE